MLGVSASKHGQTERHSTGCDRLNTIYEKSKFSVGSVVNPGERRVAADPESAIVV